MGSAPSIVPASAYTNKAPLFFCAPGSKEGCTEEVKGSFTTGSTTTAEKCRTCGEDFPSKDKLHEHLRQLLGHQAEDIGNLDSPAPWPPGKELRVKVLPGEKTHDAIEGIIRTTAFEWMTGLSESLTLQWVSSGESADIRISFRN